MGKKLTLIVALALSLALPAVAGERTLTLDPEASRVDFTLGATGHDVSGSFRVQSGAMTFDDTTGALSGEIRVDAKSAKTGNGSRDKTMHGDVLESVTFPLFVFRANRLEGHVADAGRSSVKLHGVISMHGAEHPLVMPASVDVNGNTLSATSAFAIPFVEWGMDDPSLLFLRVEKSVKVTVTATGTLSATAHEGGAR